MLDMNGIKTEGVIQMSESGGRRSFVVSDEMRKYFIKIGVTSSRKEGNSKSGYFPTFVHPYYLCMVLGIIKGKQGNPGPMKETMVDTWAVSDAAGWEHEISGLSFFMHCKRLGLVGDSTSDRILNEMDAFFEKHEHFTIEGYSMMNQYAQGGFEIIQEEIGSVKDLANWLSLYLALL